MIRPGDIGLSAKRTGWYPKTVRFFTRSKYSHVFIVAEPYYGKITVIEANIEIGIRLFDHEYVQKNDDSFRIFRPIKATEAEIYMATSATARTCIGLLYGFLQIPWFAFRAIFGLFGIKLTRNWFPFGQICSETPLIYLKLINEEYREAFAHLSENETSPEDIAKVVENRPDLFEFVMERV